MFCKSDNFEPIYIHKLNEVVACGKCLYYPNVLLYSKLDSKIYQPLDETTMSLRGVSSSDKEEISISNDYKQRFNTPVFYFVYNTDNYYHFIYDSLPYLISFIKLTSS